MGDYEGLNEQPVARSADLDFICFTDNHSIESQTWKIIHVEAAWPTDAVRSARALKVLGHPALDEYSRTIWMDNSIVLLSDPSFLLSHLEKAPLVLLDHPFRETVADEFAEVIAVGYDDQARVIEQRNAYALVNPRVLEEDVLATGIMVRRRSSEVTTTMRVWMDHILRYSRRDQLSINYVLATTGTPFLRIFEDLRAVTWASWPHTPERDRSRGLRDPLVLQQPPFLLAAQIRERERSLETRLRDVTRERDILRSEAVAMAEIRARELDHAATRHVRRQMSGVTPQTTSTTSPQRGTRSEASRPSEPICSPAGRGGSRDPSVSHRPDCGLAGNPMRDPVRARGVYAAIVPECLRTLMSGRTERGRRR